MNVFFSRLLIFTLLVACPICAKQAPPWFGWNISDRTIDRKLSQRGVSLGTVNDRGDTPLIAAIRLGNVERALKYLRAGADVNAVSLGFYRRSALHWACRTADVTGSERLIHALVEHGAGVRMLDGKGMTPIHHLVSLDNTERRLNLIEYLVKQGADLNARDNDGETLLHLVAENRNHGFTRRYVDRFGSLLGFSLKDSEGHTASQWARDLGFVAIAEIIEAGEKKAHKLDGGPLGLTDLGVAVLRGETDRVAPLVRLGQLVDGTSRGEFRRTGLHFAVVRGDGPMVLALRRAGASLDRVDSDGDRPIHLLAQVTGEAEVVATRRVKMSKREKNTFMKNLHRKIKYLFQY